MIGWLARRVLTRGDRATTLTVLLALGAGVIVFLGLSSASTLDVVAHHRDRVTATRVKMDPAQSSGKPSDLRIVDPRITNSRRVDGYDVRREFYVAGDKSAPVPVGVPRVPAVGEFFASPDLTALIRTNPAVARLFEGQRMVGTVKASGLVEPHELRAVVGAPRDFPLLTKVDGFGGMAAANVTEDSGNRALNVGVLLYVLTIVWLPVVFFVLLIAKLAAARRRTRSAALHLIGYPKWRIQLLHCVEAFVVCLPGTLVAGVIHWLGTRSSSEVPGTSFGFFAQDARLSWLTYVAISATILLVLCLAVSSDLRPLGGTKANTDRQDATGMTTALGSAALVTGLVMLALPSLMSVQGGLTPLTIWIGIVLVSGGLALAGPRLVMKLLNKGAGKSSAAALIGRRMAAHKVTTSLRLASVLSVIVVLLIGSQAFTAVLSGGSVDDWQARVEKQANVPVVATDLAEQASLADVKRSARIKTVAELQSATAAGASVNIVFATCGDVVRLSGRRDAGQCSGVTDPVWIGHNPNASREVTPDELTIDSRGKPLALSGTNGVRQVIDVPGVPEPFVGALLLPPEQSGHVADAEGGTFFLVIPSRVLTPTISAVGSISPAIQFDLGALDRHNPDTQQYRSQIEWLGVGAIAGLSIAFLSMIVVAIGEAEERSRRMRALRVIGASKVDLLVAHIWCVAVPVLMVGFAAIGLGWLVAQAMHNVDDRAHVAIDTYGLIALVVPIAAAVVASATWPAVSKRSSRSGSVNA
jgi:hypothetical protein